MGHHGRTDRIGRGWRCPCRVAALFRLVAQMVPLRRKNMDFHASSFVAGLILGGFLPFVDLAAILVLEKRYGRKQRKNQVEPVLNSNIQN